MPPRPQINHVHEEDDDDTHGNNSKSLPVAATVEYGRSPTLIKAVPSSFPTPLPWYYNALSKVSCLVVPGLFYAGPLLWASMGPVLFLCRTNAKHLLQYGGGWMLFNAFLTFVPIRKWPYFRQFFQLWYERYDFHHNLLPTTNNSTRANSTTTTTIDEDNAMTIYSTHPHGIIPIHGYLWCALCDQIMPQRYGVGALTDVAMRLPLLRHVMGWLSSTPATKSNLLRHLNQGTNLWILPGGVAEIFLSQRLTRQDMDHRGRYQHVVQTPRRGLMKMALETGAVLVPCYAFGATDFFHQLATYHQASSSAASSKDDANHNHNNHDGSGNKADPTNFVGKLQCYLSRKMQGGLTFFWGLHGTTLPYAVKCTYVVGDPIEPVVGTWGQSKSSISGKLTCQKVTHPTDVQIEELQRRYTAALLALFEQYKVEAGHANAELVFK